jgi:hypothetical protein
MIFDVGLQDIHHQSNIQIVSREMPLNSIMDIRLNTTAANMAQVKNAISIMLFAQYSCHRMPLQSLIGIREQPTLVQMVLAREHPILEFLLH